MTYHEYRQLLATWLHELADLVARGEVVETDVAQALFAEDTYTVVCPLLETQRDPGDALAQRASTFYPGPTLTGAFDPDDARYPTIDSLSELQLRSELQLLRKRCPVLAEDVERMGVTWDQCCAWLKWNGWTEINGLLRRRAEDRHGISLTQTAIPRACRIAVVHKLAESEWDALAQMASVRGDSST